jgi:hypothetical protein
MADKRKGTSSKQSKGGGGIISSVVDQTTRIAGEMIDTASSMTNTARETGADWVKGVSPTAADVLRPGGKSKAAGGRASRQPRKGTAAGTAAASVASQARKTTKSVGRAATGATKTAGRAAAKTARRVTKQAARPAAKKGGAKKR